MGRDFHDYIDVARAVLPGADVFKAHGRLPQKKRAGNYTGSLSERANS
jgi:hypothetical protein